ncbi:MAG: hypothetical protein DI622_01680 [Chryseobacterium sp.]|uniref:hypothetical protein n=1 Tax=Chryseobacterium sp. TaxID=1871047 RepID=UPI000DB279AD|nr:hypothetical protein [Chryseobacterium sp.]MPS65226.1 hypothetical protein [Chryseobacterium sp.]PZU26089.1 MAG: hypothetical protein DI622_01680 [Chryseobacterium sp.]
MKKIIIIGSIVFSGLAFAQHSDNPYIYDEPSQTSEVEKSPGEPGDPSAPIDEQIPFLMIAAIGMAIVFAKRKKSVDSF